jgi:hypothetical protein
VIYDGSMRLRASNVWLARNGQVAITGDGQPVYDLRERPDGTPDDDPYWSTPDIPDLFWDER